MLYSYNELNTCSTRASDGRSGRVDEFYFDDSNWHIRYFLAHSGFLLTDRPSLVRARLPGTPETQEVPVNLFREELKAIKRAETVSRHCPIKSTSGSSECLAID